MTKHLIVIALAAIALQGCATKTPPTQTATEDLEGIAKACEAAPVNPVAGATTDATIAMSNNGWCAVRVVEKDGEPFMLGLVPVRPEHGRVLIHKVFGRTRIEYTPDDRYVGPDRFTALLRSRQPNTPDATLLISVNVSMGEGMVPTPAAAAPAAPPVQPKPAHAKSSRVRKK